MLTHPSRWLALLAGLAVGLAAVSGRAAQEEKKGEKKLKVGDVFPDVALQVTSAKEILGKDQKTVKISDLKGKNVVVWFFPKAMTPG